MRFITYVHQAQPRQLNDEYHQTLGCTTYGDAYIDLIYAIYDFCRTIHQDNGYDTWIYGLRISI